MADLQVSIKDEQSAKQWLEMVRDINTDYHAAMTDASETLINMKDFADGTLVDEYYKYGTELLNAAEVTFTAIDEIAGTVNKIFGAVDAFVESAAGGVIKAFTSVLG